MLAFARTFGVLGLCQHGLPFGHMMLDTAPTSCRWSTREPLALWHLFAREALAIRNLGKALLPQHMSRVGAREDWRALVRAWQHRNYPRVTATRRRNDIEHLVDAIIAATRAERRMIVARSIEAGLVDAGVRPSLTWGDDLLQVRLNYGTGITAVVARMLMSDITNTETPSACANCGDDIPAHRRWCSRPECQQAARAQATRDHRARKRRGTKPGTHTYRTLNHGRQAS